MLVSNVVFIQIISLFNTFSIIAIMRDSFGVTVYYLLVHLLSAGQFD
jgi:hypothetical protein